MKLAKALRRDLPAERAQGPTAADVILAARDDAGLVGVALMAA